MTAFILLIGVFILADVVLYQKYWQEFAARYYYAGYTVGMGWAIAAWLRRK